MLVDLFDFDLLKYFTYLLEVLVCYTFQRRFTINPLAIIRPEHCRTISGQRGLDTQVLPNTFPGAHKAETVLSHALILRPSELRPTLGKQLAQSRLCGDPVRIKLATLRFQGRCPNTVPPHSICKRRSTEGIAMRSSALTLKLSNI